MWVYRLVDPLKYRLSLFSPHYFRIDPRQQTHAQPVSAAPHQSAPLVRCSRAFWWRWLVFVVSLLAGLRQFDVSQSVGDEERRARRQLRTSSVALWTRSYWRRSTQMRELRAEVGGAVHLGGFTFLRSRPTASSSSELTAEKHFNASSKMSLRGCRSLQTLDQRGRPACPDRRTIL